MQALHQVQTQQDLRPIVFPDAVLGRDQQHGLLQLEFADRQTVERRGVACMAPPLLPTTFKAESGASPLCSGAATSSPIRVAGEPVSSMARIDNAVQGDVEADVTLVVTSNGTAA